MATLQEWIHRLEVGEGTRLVRLVAALLALVALAWWYDSRAFRNFSGPEAMEAAHLARNLAQGEGFTTRSIRPLSLHLVERARGAEAGLREAPHPDLVTPPLYPLLLAGLMKVLPFNFNPAEMIWKYQPELLIAVFNQGLFLLTLGLIYFLGRRLFDTEVAMITVALLAVSDVLWRFSTSGHSTMLALLLLTALAGVVVRWFEIDEGAGESPRGSWRWAVLAGVLAGLLGLTRYSLLALLIPLALLPWVTGLRHPWRISATVVFTALVLVAPWLWRNHHHSGTWFGIAGKAIYQETTPFRGAKLERSLSPDLSRVAPRDIARKLVESGERMVREDLPRLGGNWLGGLFLAGLILRFRNRTVGRLRWFVLGSLVTLVMAQGAARTHLSDVGGGIHSENLLILLSPLLVLFGAGLLSALLDQLELPIPELRHAITLGLTLIAAIPLLLTFMPPRTMPIAYPPYYPRWIQANAALLEPDELMMSDMPWAVAWYGNRQCVWIPMEAGPGFYEIHDRHKRVAALYLTQLTSDGRFLTEVIQSRDHEWARFVLKVLVNESLPPRFPLTHVWQRYLPDQLLFADRPRWRELRPRSSAGAPP